VRRYMQVMLSDRRKLPDLSELKVTNHMNREAIQQVRKGKIAVLSITCVPKLYS